MDATYYKLADINSSKCLESPSSTSGAILQQGTDDSTDLQRWAIDYYGSGNVFTLTNKANGMKMSMNPESSTPGSKMRQNSAVSKTQGKLNFIT